MDNISDSELNTIHKIHD